MEILTMKLLPLLALVLCSCSNIYYGNGQKAASIGSNVGHFAMKSNGLEVTMDNVDNAIIHREVGNNTEKLGVSVGTSGLLPFLRGLF